MNRSTEIHHYDTARETANQLIGRLLSLRDAAPAAADAAELFSEYLAVCSSRHDLDSHDIPGNAGAYKPMGRPFARTSRKTDEGGKQPAFGWLGKVRLFSRNSDRPSARAG